ncbi:hypothetical protein B0F90DRAFT_1704128 [Multifurca ochricompacta]|uniref:F-box domain-containing protein n=1 Tax=Multifurca ochricompacta TaxID=376703 RepID=A0AAD4M6S2_9AGAM|nr:hypothetical protein B0F90DRAFT_1704128 [Multifurca ochricompacta]
MSIERFRRQDIDGALKYFDEAICLADDTSYALYDSRASLYEKQNRLKDALRDAKKTIDIAPTQWHGYFRSARLFAALNKSTAALRMCSLALEYLGNDAKHEARRCELANLQMPVELLLMVFELSGRPVVFSHVCSRWRKKALRKVQEWRRRSCGRITELTIRKSLGEIIFPLGNGHPAHPDDVTIRDDILFELQSLDLAHVKACHSEDMDVAVFFAALSRDGLETVSTSQRYPDGFVFGKVVYANQPWTNLRALSIGNMKYLCIPMDLAPIRQFLQVNPGLEKLTIEAATVSPKSPADILAALTFTHLRHLELSGVLISPLLPLSLPSLQVLRCSRLPDSATMLRFLVEDPGTSFAEIVELTMKECHFEQSTIASTLLQAPKLKILQLTGNLDIDVIAESLAKPCAALLRFPHPEDTELVPTELPILCPALSVLDLSGSPGLRTGPVMRIVKERIALSASRDGGGYKLLGQDDDQRVSCIQVLKIDECPYIEAEMLPWFRKNVPMFSCRYITRGNRQYVT